MTDTVVTRFAPSPTGFLHIGGARTALFNWLYAKANGGKMLLRIEDTDRERSNDEAIKAIKDGLTWLGLEWDGDAISQFSRAERHREVAHQMVANGSAYRSYMTPDEVQIERELAKQEGRSPRYDRDNDVKNEERGEPYVVRLKVPLEGETTVNDRVQGEVTFPNNNLDDLVLLRSDGTPTYMLAVVVDDHDMGVTHIIRGDDHLTNAARQTIIYKGMGWPVPEMAHIPLIHGADGAKLSKRHGAIGAEAYRSMGYLAEAMRNYLVRLGWSHGDDEIMSTEQLIDWFGFDGMNKAAARFDFAKLEAINAHYMRAMDDRELMALLESILSEVENGDFIRERMNANTSEWLLRAIPSLKERAKTLVELADSARFLFETVPLPFDEKAAQLLDSSALEAIRNIIPRLESASDWSADTISGLIRGFCEENELKLGKVAQPIRAALTGKASSPGAFDVLWILGQDEALRRLHQVISD